jgi:hypothetical protein
MLILRFALGRGTTEAIEANVKIHETAGIYFINGIVTGIGVSIPALRVIGIGPHMPRIWRHKPS